MGIRLLLATGNPGKTREFQELLSDLGVELIDLQSFAHAPEVEETGRTYEQNARLKALALARWSGLPALADDSGLEVDALGGAPGVDSANFAGRKATAEANCRKLLAALSSTPMDQRTARFRCVLVLAKPDGEWILAEGTCDGRILLEPRGTNGFGYDPLFFYPPLQKTFAELTPEEKNRVSHRARAVDALKPRLFSCLRDGPLEASSS